MKREWWENVKQTQGSCEKGLCLCLEAFLVISLLSPSSSHFRWSCSASCSVVHPGENHMSDFPLPPVTPTIPWFGINCSVGIVSGFGISYKGFPVGWVRALSARKSIRRLPTDKGERKKRKKTCKSRLSFHKNGIGFPTTPLSFGVTSRRHIVPRSNRTTGSRDTSEWTSRENSARCQNFKKNVECILNSRANRCWQDKLQGPPRPATSVPTCFDPHKLTPLNWILWLS